MRRRRVKSILMAEGTDDSPILMDIEELARAAGVPIRFAPKEMVFANARTEAPQGVIALCDELPEDDPDEMVRAAPHGSPQPFVLAVDGMTDPANLGALLRSAQGAGVTGVLLPEHRSVHVTPSAAKAAAGAIEHLRFGLLGGLASFLLRAKEHGAWIVGLDADGDQSIYDLAHLNDVPVIVVVGAEGDGLSRLVRERCDLIASIPLRAGLESLNASVAGAIALFELGRHRP
jgi:23S rRNA (guanosine2251-2'-O)-methyltransferase